MFFVGVEKVIGRLCVQYFCMTLEALCWSSVAVLPQLYLTSRDIDDVMLVYLSVFEHTHDCSAVSESPHCVPKVNVAML
jgi:hypothetical protein